MGNVCTTIQKEPLNLICPHQNDQNRKKPSIRTNFDQNYVCELCRIARQSEKQQEGNKRSIISLTTQNGDNFSVKQGSLRLKQPKIIRKTIDDFEFVRGLGRGSFGKVYLIKQKQQNALQIKQKDLMSLDIQENAIKQQAEELFLSNKQTFMEPLKESSIFTQHQGSSIFHQMQDQRSNYKKQKSLLKKQQSEASSLKPQKQKNKQVKYYALKIISKNEIKSQQQKKQAIEQRNILQSLNHPFIVKLHYAFQTRSRLFIIVDLLQGGELFYLLRKMKKFDQVTAKFYAAEILLALEYLHKKSIIYRDLKPQNILLDSQGHIKISDFGLSKILYSSNQKTYSFCGTPEYIAPEVIIGKGYTQAADWFSFGSIIYDMLTGRPPFLSNNKHSMLKNLVSKPVPIPYYLSNNAKSLLTDLFKIKPEQRLGFKNGAYDIKKHPFFADINFSELSQRKLKPPIDFTNIKKSENDQEIFLNSNGFENWNSWHLNMQSPEYKRRKESKQFYQGFTYGKGQIEEGEIELEMQIPQDQQNSLDQ